MISDLISNRKNNEIQLKAEAPELNQKLCFKQTKILFPWTN